MGASFGTAEDSSTDIRMGTSSNATASVAAE